MATREAFRMASSTERQVREVMAAARAFDPERVARGVIERLAPAANEAVLEVGCASGRVLLPLASRLSQGLVAGVDPSDLMLRHAGMRTRRFVESGRVKLVRSTSADLSMFEDASFDHAFGIHVVTLWRDPRADLRELHRVLRPGGRLLLAYRPAAERRFAPRDGASFAIARLEALIEETGFRDAHTSRTREAGPPLAWTVGVR